MPIWRSLKWHRRGYRPLPVVVRGAKQSDIAAFLRNLSQFRVRVDRLPDETSVLRLARAQRLSVCDAAYLELAQREGLPLATLDADLRRAAACERVVILSASN
jgi:predicted nucleic acid-binding protein